MINNVLLWSQLWLRFSLMTMTKVKKPLKLASKNMMFDLWKRYFLVVQMYKLLLHVNVWATCTVVISALCLHHAHLSDKIQNHCRLSHSLGDSSKIYLSLCVYCYWCLHSLRLFHHVDAHAMCLIEVGQMKGSEWHCQWQTSYSS